MDYYQHLSEIKSEPLDTEESNNEQMHFIFFKPTVAETKDYITHVKQEYDQPLGNFEFHHELFNIMRNFTFKDTEQTNSNINCYNIDETHLMQPVCKKLIKNYWCHMCGHVVKRKKLLLHLKNHRQEIMCKKKFNNKKQNVYCNLCNFPVKHKSVYNVHIRKHVPKKFYKFILTNVNKNFKLITKNKHNYKTIIPKTDNLKYQHALHDMKSLSATDHLFECVLCKTNFKRKCDLNRHMQIHSEEKPFECMFCNYKARRKHHIKRHNMLIHSEIKPLKCPHCTYKSLEENKLETHMQVHTGYQLLRCPFCEKKFVNPDTLTKHMQMHTGEKPFKCLNCDSRFNRKYHLQRHTLRVHMEQKFKCSLCDYISDKRSNLHAHMQNHPDEKLFKCLHCNSVFGRKDSLTRHMLIHTGVKPFKCQYCESRFSRKYHLKRHYNRVHEGKVFVL